MYINAQPDDKGRLLFIFKDTRFVYDNIGKKLFTHLVRAWIFVYSSIC